MHFKIVPTLISFCCFRFCADQKTPVADQEDKFNKIFINQVVYARKKLGMLQSSKDN